MAVGDIQLQLEELASEAAARLNGAGERVIVETCVFITVAAVAFLITTM